MTTQVENTFVTREEFRAAIDDLNAKVQGLYNLADRLGYTVDIPAVQSNPESVPTAVTPTRRVETVTQSNGQTAGVDYSAVAYGLTSLRNDITEALGSSQEITRRYAATVDWFVSCFAGDASFDADTFRRNAGV